MGLKIRRLKSGFAYYAEYKFGGRCIYESIEAASAREAKRRYAARRRELMRQHADAPAPATVRQAGDGQINAVLGALLRTLVTRRLLSDAEVRELIDGAFRQFDLMPGSATAQRARETIRQALLAAFSGAVPAGDAHRAQLVPQEIDIPAASMGDLQVRSQRESADVGPLSPAI